MGSHGHDVGDVGWHGGRDGGPVTAGHGHQRCALYGLAADLLATPILGVFYQAAVLGQVRVHRAPGGIIIISTTIILVTSSLFSSLSYIIITIIINFLILQ